jgi:EAL domain-containing protein (putative c-di-GMP-specific phosphodiesterase class I)
MAEQARLIHDLRSAILLNQLYVVYQEQVNIQGITEGVEALMRWEHPEKGLISPAHFIPLAENSGIIISLGDWIFTKVIEQLQEWKADSVKQHWRISVNVSPKQFEEETYVAKLQEHIARTQIDPAKIRLELTEGLLIQDTQNAMEKIHILKAIGFSFSIDDFGTGYSSLSYLKHLPIDELKIDQSFVKMLPESISDQTIIQTIITIGKTFGLEVIAEGVETTEQFELLRIWGAIPFKASFQRPQRRNITLRNSIPSNRHFPPFEMKHSSLFRTLFHSPISSSHSFGCSRIKVPIISIQS